MELVLAIATILGGLTAIMYLVERFGSSDIAFKYLKINRKNKSTDLKIEDEPIKNKGVHVYQKKAVFVKNDNSEVEVNDLELILINLIGRKGKTFDHLVLYGELSINGTKRTLNSLIAKGIVQKIGDGNEQIHKLT